MSPRSLIVVLPMLLASCAGTTSSPVELRLLAINDFHGNIQSSDPSPGRVAVVRDGKQELVEVGGAAYLAAIVARERADHANTMLISAGDLTGASPMLSGLLKDEPTIRVMNQIGLDINVVGNHEFDLGRGELMRKSLGDCATSLFCPEGSFTGAAFEYLAANVVDADNGKPLFPAYVVREFEGVEIAFIGVVTRETPSIVAARGVAGLTFLDEAETLNRYARELTKRGVRAIVAVLHEGSNAGPDTPLDGSDCVGLSGELNEIVARVDPAIDLFVTGHTHQSYACRLGGRLVTQAGNYGRSMSIVDLLLDPADGEITSASAHNVAVTHDVAPDTGILAELTLAEVATAPIRQEKAATLPSALTRQQNEAGESALGDVVADAQLAATRNLGAVIALTNLGGIRQDLPSDPEKGLGVALSDLFAVQPFGNNLVVMDVSGAQLKLLLEQQWIGQPDDRKPRILQISKGFSYCYDDRRAEGNKILAETISLDGEVLRPDVVYRIAVNNFLAGGGDRFKILTEGRNLVQGGGDLDALRDYVKGHADELSDKPKGRICRRL
ncbi:MAG: bifunctional metallophosphatase/5'-nucleotidase [Rhodospirillaceae bacterium]|nr:bifunctional metallophosphatase/5'-nucleotidase [Rhodospirillaceae bacterium]